MPNPFSGIISSAFKQTFRNAINALLETTALTVPCKLVYGATKFTACTNCIINTATGSSTNKYNGTGPKPFTSGQCLVCNGLGKVNSQTEETIYIAVVYDIKKWLNMNLENIPKGSVQTICSIEYLPKLLNAEYIIVNTDIEDYTRNKFNILGGPQPAGLGSDDYVFIAWKKV